MAAVGVPPVTTPFSRLPCNALCDPERDCHAALDYSINPDIEKLRKNDVGCLFMLEPDLAHYQCAAPNKFYRCVAIDPAPEAPPNNRTYPDTLYIYPYIYFYEPV